MHHIKQFILLFSLIIYLQNEINKFNFLVHINLWNEKVLILYLRQSYLFIKHKSISFLRLSIFINQINSIEDDMTIYIYEFHSCTVSFTWSFICRFSLTLTFCNALLHLWIIKIQCSWSKVNKIISLIIINTFVFFGSIWPKKFIYGSI